MLVLAFSTDFKKKANESGMASEWSYTENLNSSCGIKCQWNFDEGKGNLVRVGGEFDFTEWKMTEKWGEIPRNWDF